LSDTRRRGREHFSLSHFHILIFAFFFSSDSDEQLVRKRMADLLKSLAVFGQINLALDEMFVRMGHFILRLANATAKLILLNASGNGSGGGMTDSAHLAQFVHIVSTYLYLLS